MEHLGYNKEAYARADANISLICNPYPEWKRKQDRILRDLNKAIRGEW